MAIPLTDPGNDLIAISPATLTTGKITLPDGRTMIVATIRTPTTTLTMLLNKGDCKSWGQTLTEEADSTPGAGLVAAPGSIMNGKKLRTGG